MSAVGGALKKSGAMDAAAEPSMDEILASIRQIIAEDEGPVAHTEKREDYRSPSQHSNNNAPTAPDEPAPPAADFELDDPDFDASMEAELQKAVEQQFRADVQAKTDTAVAQASAAGAAASSAQLGVAPAASATAPSNGAGQQEAVAGTTVAEPGTDTLPPQISAPSDIQARAERVRRELGLSNAADGGLTLEQRLERYRVRGKGLPPLADPAAPPPQPVTPIATAAAPVSATRFPTAEEVAHAMLKQRSEETESQLQAALRPAVHKWLSDNLPAVVERLVRQEIERVSRGN